MDRFKSSLHLLGCIIAFVSFLPTLFYVAKNEDGIFYQNINQINNGGSITGYITWESLYSEDLMTTIENDIGKDMTTYRVASIGICPVVTLMHGFYTIDGYSNNYSLDYKHTFGEIISGELEQNSYIYSYFYDWGNRCYLFYHEWGNGFLLGKNYNLTITNPQFDFDKMRELNCQYIFSAGVIEDADDYGLALLNVYEDDTSYWRIWVYELGENNVQD